MSRLAKIMIGLVALLHLYIAWFGIFAWQGQGPATFPDLPASLFEPTTAMAVEWQRKVATAFLLFVTTAGIFGAWRVSADIALVQAGPSVIGILLLWLPVRKTRKRRQA